MEQNKKTTIDGFKAVHFMRTVRDKISEDIKDMNFMEIEQYFKDRRLKLSEK